MAGEKALEGQRGGGICVPVVRYRAKYLRYRAWSTGQGRAESGNVDVSNQLTRKGDAFMGQVKRKYDIDVVFERHAVKIDRLRRAESKTYFMIGVELLAAKEALDHGQWLPFLDDPRVGFDERSAQRYMRLAEAQDGEKLSAYGVAKADHLLRMDLTARRKFLKKHDPNKLSLPKLQSEVDLFLNKKRFAFQLAPPVLMDYEIASPEDASESKPMEVEYEIIHPHPEDRLIESLRGKGEVTPIDAEYEQVDDQQPEPTTAELLDEVERVATALSKHKWKTASKEDRDRVFKVLVAINRAIQALK